ncbi:ATP-binding cassette domain-containing protein [Hyphobacterium sp. CCMP332]|nr:ATP-binding cassette domain-containing protein [Hyphobacterium sp. CCMP332]
MSFAPDLVLEVRNAFIYQEENAVLKDISFNVTKGEFVYLIGRTGSGKSSLLKTLYADLPFNSGEIVIAGHRINGIPRKEIPELRRKIGIVFQDFQLLMDRSVEENLVFVMKATGWKESSKIKQRLSSVLMRVGLGSLGSKLPHQLSGGEQQRVAIARSLINDPQLLIADEPTGNLDPQVAEGILNLFQEINKGGTAVLMATHNHNFIEKIPARVIKCAENKIFDSKSESFSFTDIW